MLVAFFISRSTIDQLLSSYGYPVVFAMVAGESLGIPLPGETTLIAAALFAGATGSLDIRWVVAIAAAAAVAGDNLGFTIGRVGGLRLLRRYGERLRIDERRLRLGRYVFLRHGGKVVFFGRFVSILRAYAAFLAGTNRMTWWRFLAFNALGGAIWAAIYGFGYFYFGQALEGLQTTVDVAIGAAAVAVLTGFGVLLRRKERDYAERADRELPDEALDELG